MNERQSRGAEPRRAKPAQWFTGVSIALVVLVCLAIFIFAFVQLDPYLSDFVSDDATPTESPTAEPFLPSETDPDADGTPEGLLRLRTT
jgi:hypothetical protein